MKYLLIGVLSLSIFATACEDPAANKTKATINEPSNAANTVNSTNSSQAVSSKGEALALTPENSKIGFTGSKVTGKHEGGFKEFTGTIDLVGEKAENSRVNVTIETNSIFANDDKLTTHLKSADFFDAEKFPKTTFASTKIVADASKGADAYNVTGDFEIHGVKKSITFPATIKVGADDVSVLSEFSINRKDFGIVYAGKADDLIRDDVAIKLELKAPRKK